MTGKFKNTQDSSSNKNPQVSLFEQSGVCLAEQKGHNKKNHRINTEVTFNPKITQQNNNHGYSNNNTNESNGNELNSKRENQFYYDLSNNRYSQFSKINESDLQGERKESLFQQGTENYINIQDELESFQDTKPHERKYSRLSTHQSKVFETDKSFGSGKVTLKNIQGKISAKLRNTGTRVFTKNPNTQNRQSIQNTGTKVQFQDHALAKPKKKIPLYPSQKKQIVQSKTSYQGACNNQKPRQQPVNAATKTLEFDKVNNFNINSIQPKHEPILKNTGLAKSKKRKKTAVNPSKKLLNFLVSNNHHFKYNDNYRPMNTMKHKNSDSKGRIYNDYIGNNILTFSKNSSYNNSYNRNSVEREYGKESKQSKEQNKQLISQKRLRNRTEQDNPSALFRNNTASALLGRENARLSFEDENVNDNDNPNVQHIRKTSRFYNESNTDTKRTNQTNQTNKANKINQENQSKRNHSHHRPQNIRNNNIAYQSKKEQGNHHSKDSVCRVLSFRGLNSQSLNPDQQEKSVRSNRVTPHTTTNQNNLSNNPGNFSKLDFLNKSWHDLEVNYNKNNTNFNNISLSIDRNFRFNNSNFNSGEEVDQEQMGYLEGISEDNYCSKSGKERAGKQKEDGKRGSFDFNDSLFNYNFNKNYKVGSDRKLKEKNSETERIGPKEEAKLADCNKDEAKNAHDRMELSDKEKGGTSEKNIEKKEEVNIKEDSSRVIRINTQEELLQALYSRKNSENKNDSQGNSLILQKQDQVSATHKLHKHFESNSQENTLTDLTPHSDYKAKDVKEFKDTNETKTKEEAAVQIGKRKVNLNRPYIYQLSTIKVSINSLNVCDSDTEKPKGEEPGNSGEAREAKKSPQKINVILAEHLVIILDFIYQTINPGLIEIADFYTEERRKHFIASFKTWNISSSTEDSTDSKKTYLNIINSFLKKKEEFFLCVLYEVMVRLSINKSILDDSFMYYMNTAEVDEKVLTIRKKYAEVYNAGIKYSVTPKALLDFNKIKTILEYQLNKYKELSQEIRDFEILEIVVNDFIYYEFGYDKDCIKSCLGSNSDLSRNSVVKGILKETDDYIASLMDD
eukprot:CAMPEP_0170539554 /NCGR_PEP_ID=MMETSP0209-20121228/104013_1 /TAXON_ID=665100 ORGANISM="Litonotus pictus, Strain P1" /NCGR_SAMPLE_ID=MMETSP0209 /ASSEMBLY_ACC=CAM_ASM_000301 /LENGTH=1076 /DNA_ID=CAMNT_0010841539 /DNA_START=356 /DNA_END=3583 /DNA_ORIENTATION=+